VATDTYYSKSIGAFGFGGGISVTEDRESKTGTSGSLSASVDKYNLFADVSASMVSADYRPRLGYTPETDVQSVNGLVGHYRNYQRGFLNDYYLTISGYKSTRLNGQPHSSGKGASFNTTLRSGYSLSLYTNQSEYEGDHDELTSASLSYPLNNPFNNVSLSWSSGRFAEHDYRDFSLGAKYRPWRRLQLGLSYQQVDHFESNRQAILTAAYELNDYDSVSGRMIQLDGKSSFYVAYRRAGNFGAEYFLIVGDPNFDPNRAFRPSVVLKVVWPFVWR
jgi:outer membrane usher protein FimD/PapC